MQMPMEISFRQTERTPELEDLIQEKAAKLDQVCPYLTGCRIAIEKPQEHQRQGRAYRVRLEVTVPPNHQVVVTREPGEGEMHQPLGAVVREAFEVARRNLVALVEQQRREIKRHPEQEADAWVTQVFPDEGYGFAKTLDGREIYFHRNSVAGNQFEALRAGTAVRLVVVQGEKGPQASTVQRVEPPRASAGETE